MNMQKDVPLYVVVFEDQESLFITPSVGFEHDEVWRRIAGCQLAGARRTSEFSNTFAPIIRATNPANVWVTKELTICAPC